MLTFILPKVMDTSTNKLCMVVNVDGACKILGQNKWVPNEFRLAIKKENGGVNGRKAWFLSPNTNLETGRPVVYKRTGSEKNARNLQASYIYHESLTPEALEEILSCE